MAILTGYAMSAKVTTFLIMYEYDPQEKELVKKLDRRLLPSLIMLFLAYLFDVNAAIHGRHEDAVSANEGYIAYTICILN
jgi:hypothetical protein